MWRRPAVSTIRTSRRSSRARSSAQLGDVDRVGVGAFLVDVGAGAPAHRHQLLDRGGPVDVAGGERDVFALGLK